MLQRVFHTQIPCHAGKESRHLPPGEGKWSCIWNNANVCFSCTLILFFLGSFGRVWWISLVCDALAGPRGQFQTIIFCDLYIVLYNYWLLFLSFFFAVYLQGLSREAPKKLRFVPGIIHIDGNVLWLANGICFLSQIHRRSLRSLNICVLFGQRAEPVVWVQMSGGDLSLN